MEQKLITRMEQLNSLEKEIESYGKTMVDGAIDNEEYLKSKYKSAWFLKESYSKEEVSQYYRSHFESDDLYEDWFKNVATPTWHPIIYISYSILNGFKTWQELEYIRDNPHMCNVIKNIAIINANKHYSETGTWTDDTNLFKGFKKFENILKNQIDLLEPNVLIFANTFYLYKELFEIKESDKITDLSMEGLPQIYYKDSKIFVDAYHPAYPKKQLENYINSIINSVKITSSNLL